jgi:phospholipid-translocating ATPase
VQAADVGVGIAGEEGLQAVNSSDYAIAQVCGLSGSSRPGLLIDNTLVPLPQAIVARPRPLVLRSERKHVGPGMYWAFSDSHGDNRILNFFYKNIVCVGVLWWFQIYCGWSSN